MRARCHLLSFSTRRMSMHACTPGTSEGRRSTLSVTSLCTLSFSARVVAVNSPAHMETGVACRRPCSKRSSSGSSLIGQSKEASSKAMASGQSGKDRRALPIAAHNQVLQGGVISHVGEWEE